jgi:hypothetical protein
MSVASLEPNALLAYVERVKASWRETERHKTWEEKIAAIERMRARELQLKRARESVAALRANVVSASGGRHARTDS